MRPSRGMALHDGVGTSDRGSSGMANGSGIAKVPSGITRVLIVAGLGDGVIGAVLSISGHGIADRCVGRLGTSFLDSLVDSPKW